MKLIKVFCILIACTFPACGENLGTAPIPVKSEAPEQPTAPIEKTEEQWKEVLTPEQFYVLRKAGTEPPNSPLYKDFKKHKDGIYYCAGCGAELFSAKEKFDSGSGWPSFYDPSEPSNVKTDVDYKIGVARTEIKCAFCDGHLGHVFVGEGYKTPTNKRYCVNGTALVFVEESEKTDSEDSKK